MLSNTVCLRQFAHGRLSKAQLANCDMHKKLISFSTVKASHNHDMQLDNIANTGGGGGGGGGVGGGRWPKDTARGEQRRAGRAAI